MAVHFEPGRYICRVTEQGWQETKKSKLPMLVFTFTPTYLMAPGAEIPEAVYPDPARPERNLYLVIDQSDDQKMEYAMKKLRGAGFTGTSFSQLDLVGKDIHCICDHSEYNGKPTEQWDFILPPKEGPNPLTPAVARRLDALFGARLKEGAGEQRPPLNAGKHQPSMDAQAPASPQELATAGAHHSNSELDDDSIPF